MGKTLSNILTVFKVARIIAKIVFILCIIGGAGCLLGLSALPLAEAVLSAVGEGVIVSSAYAGCIIGLFACTGEAVFAFFAERYFKNVLKAGTPFTFEGAKESFRLGIMSIIISVAVSIITGFIASIVLLFMLGNTADIDFNTSFSLSTGLFFLFMSLIFKHGAEVQQAYAERTYAENSYTEEQKQENQNSNTQE